MFTIEILTTSLQLQSKLDLYEKLSVAEVERANNAPKTSHDDLMKILRTKYNA